MPEAAAELVPEAAAESVPEPAAESVPDLVPSAPSEPSGGPKQFLVPSAAISTPEPSGLTLSLEPSGFF